MPKLPKSGKKPPTTGVIKVPEAKPIARARTKTDQDAIYLQVTKSQGDVIRAKADREKKSIKDVILDGLMDRSELEAECAMLRNTLTEYQRAMKDIQALLLGASTERALTKEEAQVFQVANRLLIGGAR